MSESRYCAAGCGYKLPEEYTDDEDICGACLDNPETWQVPPYESEQ
jgi:hypothetical protein